MFKEGGMMFRILAGKQGSLNQIKDNNVILNGTANL
jgi:hypothetical protein